MCEFPYLLTVIIPYHNNQDELDRLLESIGVYPNIEVLVVDDQSDVRPIIASTVTHSVRILSTNASRRWAGSARNIGLSAARSKYVCFADSDDVFVPAGMKSLMAFIHDKEFDLCIARVTSSSEDAEISSRRHAKYNQILDDYKDSQAPSALFRYHVPWGKIFRLDFLKCNDVRFDEIIASNDVMFSLRAILSASAIEIFDETLYCVFDRAGSLTKSRSHPVLEARFWTLCAYNDLLRESGFGEYEGAMSGQLFRLFRYHHRFFWKGFWTVLRRRYPIFYDFAHIRKVIRRYI